jgi:hypothetical protein
MLVLAIYLVLRKIVAVPFWQICSAAAAVAAVGIGDGDLVGGAVVGGDLARLPPKPHQIFFPLSVTV